MKRHSTIDRSPTASKADSTHNPEPQVQSEQLPATALGELPNRLLTAFEVAEFVGCHEETVRRAYLRGLLIPRGSAFEPAAFTRATSWTGFVAGHQLEFRSQKGAMP